MNEQLDYDAGFQAGRAIDQPDAAHSGHVHGVPGLWVDPARQSAHDHRRLRG